MKISPLADEGKRRVFQIEIPWAEIADDYEALIARYSHVRLPGFRQGRIPQAIIEQRFARKLCDDLSTCIVQRLGREAVLTMGIEPLGPLEAFAIECKRDRPFRAQIRFLPLPDFKVPALTDLTTEKGRPNDLDSISCRLLELIPFEIPGELVRQELELDGLGETPADSEDWKAASRRIRLLIILKRIAREQGIEVEESDVNRRIIEKAQEFDTSAEMLMAELVKGGGMIRLQEMLLAERTLEYLLEIIR